MGAKTIIGEMREAHERMRAIVAGDARDGRVHGLIGRQADLSYSRKLFPKRPPSGKSDINLRMYGATLIIGAHNSHLPQGIDWWTILRAVDVA